MLIQAIHTSTGFKLGVLRKTWAKFLKEARAEEEAATLPVLAVLAARALVRLAHMARREALIRASRALLASSAWTRPGFIGARRRNGPELRGPSKFWVTRAT